MKLVIHAGIHRTGTTSLQHFLAQNRTPLAALGFAYPGTGNNHQPLAWALKNGSAGAAEVAALFDAEQAPETVVLSGEDFCIHTQLGWLEEISRSHPTRVVFYLRRQDHWLMSWYNQHIKWPFDRRKSVMTRHEFLAAIGDFHWLDYSVMLERWARVIGRENLEVAVVETGQVEDVVGDFIARLGIPRESLGAEEKRVNDSLPVHLLEIARNLNMFELPPKSRIHLIRALRLGLAQKAQPAKTLYSPAERLGILQRFEHANREVANRFFGRDELFLEPLPAADEPYYEFPEVSRETLLREWIAPILKHCLPPP
jgi:hypothetical protein